MKILKHKAPEDLFLGGALICNTADLRWQIISQSETTPFCTNKTEKGRLLCPDCPTSGRLYFLRSSLNHREVIDSFCIAGYLMREGTEIVPTLWYIVDSEGQILWREFCEMHEKNTHT